MLSKKLVNVHHVQGDPWKVPYDFSDFDYWVFTTMDCNLRCRYCFVDRSAEEYKQCITEPQYSPRDLATFIMINNSRSPLGEHTIVFSGGGEPTVNERSRKFAREVIRETSDLGVSYALQTNGTLLYTLDDELLDKLSWIFVSIDGDREVTDKDRGAGVYDKIMQGLEYIKPRFKGQTMARMTAHIDPTYSLYDAVMDLIVRFDNVHWQIENVQGDEERDWDGSIKRYKSDIDRLMGWWIDELKNGRRRNIVPFQSAYLMMLAGEQNVSFPCGSGTRLVTVGLDGKCYRCDEMACSMDPEKRKAVEIGNIWDGVRLNRPDGWIDLRKKPWEEDTPKGRFLKKFLYNPVAKLTEKIP